MIKNTRVLFAKRPVAGADDECFRFEDVEVPPPPTIPA